MKFRYKIFAAYVVVYLVVFSCVAFLVTERIYQSMRSNEIEHSLNDFGRLN